MNYPSIICKKCGIVAFSNIKARDLCLGCTNKLKINKENKMNIPEYRAKKKDSNKYIVGYYFKDHEFDSHFMTDYMCTDDTEIDPSTLAIHFPDMIDSKGNKIFASLSGDGKGGDILEYNSKNKDKTVCKLIGNKPVVEWKNKWLELSEEQRHLKVIGIQE